MEESTSREAAGRGTEPTANVLGHWNPINHYAKAEDQSVLKVIQQLAAEEHRLYEHEALTNADRARLAKINIELDQCWDLLRQRTGIVGHRT